MKWSLKQEMKMCRVVRQALLYFGNNAKGEDSFLIIGNHSFLKWALK